MVTGQTTGPQTRERRIQKITTYLEQKPAHRNLLRKLGQSRGKLNCNWRPVGGSEEANLRTEHSRGAHTVNFASRSPTRFSQWSSEKKKKKKKNLIVLPLEGEEEEPSWNPPLPSVFVTESARRRTASPGPNLLGFYQNLTHLGRGGEFAVPADSSFTLQWSIPN